MTIASDWHQPRPGLNLILRGDVPLQRIQIYGQRCSGTNVVTQTIVSNLTDIRVTDDFGFKHWFVPPQTLFTKDSLVVVVARDAFDWTRSLHRQPWHAHPALKAQPFGAFIRSEWHSYWDEHVGHIEPGHPMLGAEMLHERDPATGERFANCIAKRTAKLRHWTDLPTRAHNVALISYDAFARAPDQFVADLADAVGLAPPAAFAAVTSYKGQGHFPYAATAYDALTADDVAHIQQWLDPEVEAKFGLSAEYGPRG